MLLFDFILSGTVEWSQWETKKKLNLSTVMLVKFKVFSWLAEMETYLLSLIDNFRFIKNFTIIFIRKIVKYTDHLDLDSTVLSLDWGINKNNIVRMVNWDYMVSSKIAALLLNCKIRQVPFPYHRISKLLRLPT